MPATVTFTPQLFEGDAGWSPLKLGAGGLVSGIQIADDGTKICRIDVSGAYKWTGSTWVQIFRPDTLPTSGGPYYGETDAFGGSWSQSGGSYAIAIAPSNSAYYAATLNGRLFFTTDGQATRLQKSNLARAYLPDNDGALKNVHDKMAYDTANPQVLYFCPYNGAPVRSLDGGLNFTALTGITAPTNEGAMVAVDRFSTTTNGRKPRVAIHVRGVGTYLSTDADQATPTWTLIDSSVTNGLGMTFDEAGRLYLWNASTTIRYKDGSGAGWTGSLTAPDYICASLAVDPADNTRIVISNYDGVTNVSTNRGVSWRGSRPGPINDPGRLDGKDVVATDIPWLATATTLPITKLVFDRSASNKLYASHGMGVYWSNYPNETTDRVTWNSQSAGQETMVSHYGFVPPGGAPLILQWDRPVMRSAHPTVYSRTHGVRSGVLNMGPGGDYAADDPLHIAVYAAYLGVGTSGYSLDGGKTWTEFTSQPSTAFGGCLAMNRAGKIVVAPQQNQKPRYSLNNGVSWADCNFNGVTVPVSPGFNGFGNGLMHRRQIVTADKTVDGVFYIYNYGADEPALEGVWKSTDNGANWTRVYTTSVGISDSFHVIMKCVPGKTGHLFWCAGEVQTTGTAADTDFMFSSDGAVTWNAITGFKEVRSFDFGGAYNGHSYPTIILRGWYNGVLGTWRCRDFNPTTRAGTWTNLGEPDTIARPQVVIGDPNFPNRVIVGCESYGYFNGVFA